MAERYLSDDEATATLSGTIDEATGLPFIKQDGNYANNVARAFDVISKQLFGDLRVYAVEGNDDAVGVRPGRCVIGSTEYSYAGAEPAVDGLADNDVTYVWAEDDGSGGLQIGSAVDGTGWPVGDHLKLAEVTVSSGLVSGIVDRRLRLRA
ncbi:MAG: hypothetical protein AAGI68_12200 [Planctomycetota bacterium]